MWPVDKKGLFGIGERYTNYGIGGGYCGDEGMGFEEAVSELQSNLRERISGMNYVSTKTWPSKSITTKRY